MGMVPTAARYEASTRTIRSVPGNHWLASLDSWDGAIDHEATGQLLAASFGFLQKAAALKLPADDVRCSLALAHLCDEATAIVARETREA